MSDFKFDMANPLAKCFVLEDLPPKTLADTIKYQQHEIERLQKERDEAREADCTKCLLQHAEAGDEVMSAVCVELEQAKQEIERLRVELVKVYDAIGSKRECCLRCGGHWFVPTQLRGDPRFDCPHCACPDEH